MGQARDLATEAFDQSLAQLVSAGGDCEATVEYR